MTRSEVEVVVRIDGADVLAGRLWSHRRRETESATFSYAAEYLARGDAYELDPALRLSSGSQQTPAGRAMFGAFTDCAPDRWGRRLIDRSEQQRVRREGGAGRSFGEIDYLLGVRDDLRQGAIRFRDPETGTYLADERSGVPNLVGLSELLVAAERLERDQAGESELAALLRGGSSLGGARPKAHVLHGDGRVAIAKFPSPANDDWDVIRWEAVALALARDAGIRVADSKLHPIDGKPVLVVDRFDRSGDGRVAYASAMTMLEATDGDQASYLDIAAIIEAGSPKATDDLHELWRRIALSVLISNTDDHLRNHGFLRAGGAGWSLAPAFDLNPNPHPGPKHLSTAIDHSNHAAHLETLMEVTDSFRLSPNEARTVLAKVSQATSHWQATAKATGLDRTAIQQMAPAFEHEQAVKAREIVEDHTKRL